MIAGFATVSAGADRSTPKVGPADWPTLQHDNQRSGCGPAAPGPPYRYRWAWTDGRRVDPQSLARLTKGRVHERWFPTRLIPPLVRARFHALAQPMVRDGVAYIGTVAGDLYAIDVRTGRTRWRATAGGPILHCVTVAADRVFAATLNGVDAFDLDGRILWTFTDPRRGGFWVCPALARDLVLVGGTSGHFYGLHARTGRPKWSFDAKAPIYLSPAEFDGTVYFAAENMHAHALDVATGALKWTSGRLPGFSFGHYWAVAAPLPGAVIFRTMGLRGPNRAVSVVDKAPFDYEKTQEALSTFFDRNPGDRTCAILDMKDGRERVKVPAGQFGWGGTSHPRPWCGQTGRS